MFLGGLLDGLIRSSTGAIRAQDVDVIVYSDTAQASFPRSRIDAATRACCVARTWPIGVPATIRR